MKKYLGTLLILGSLVATEQILAAKKKIPPKKARVTEDSGTLLTTSSGLGSLDSSSLKALPEAKVSDADAKARAKSLKRNDFEPTGLANVSTKEILETLRGINLLLSRNPSEPDKIKLMLNRAMASYSLARRRLLEGKGLKLDATGKRLLKIASSDASTVAATPGITQNTKARASYITGLTLVYLDDQSGARKYFVKALELDPGNESAGWMALYIAEDLFDHEGYKDALFYYKSYAKQMTPQQAEFAEYKTAWCYLNLDDKARAKKYFINLVQKNAREGFGKDSIRDLAFILSHENNEDEVFRVYDDVFGNQPDEIKVEFLSAVANNLEIQNNIHLYNKVLAKLMTLEKDPVKKLNWLIAAMRTSRREYASKVHFNAFLKIRDFLIKNGLEPGKGEFDKSRPSLDLEVQNLMKSYVETFAGRTQTAEMSKDEVGQNLKTTFDFYRRFFYDSKTYANVIRLWLEVCIDLADWKCVDSTSDIILATPELKDLQQRAALEQLIALEKWHAQDPKSLDAEKDKKLMTRLEDFVANEKQSPRWTEIAKRLGDYYVQKKDFNKALPMIEGTFEKEKSADSFYRLQWARYEAGLYEDVVNEKRQPVGPQDPRGVDLKREASLKLAADAKKSDKFDAYIANIRAFLASNPSPEKALHAKKDLYKYLLEKNRVSELTTELLRLASEERFSKEMSELLEQAWIRNMRLGRFKDAANLVTPSSKVKVSATNVSRHFLSRLALGQRPSSSDFKELSKDNKNYVWGALALSKPEWALFYANNEEKLPLHGESRQLVALALRMTAGRWSLSQSPRNEKLLSPNFQWGKVVSEGQLPAEKMIAKAYFPGGPVKPAKLSAITQDLVFITRKVRARIPQEIKGKPTDVQLRAVQAAAALEKKVGDFIAESPVPEQLKDEKQIAEYKQGIADVAKEFLDQAAEFDKLVESIKGTLDKQETEKAAINLPQPNPNAWNYPAVYKSEQMEAIRGLVESENILGALIALDLYRPEPLKDDADYYAIRSGILLASRDSEVMRKYVFDELDANKRNDVIDSWKAVTKKGGGNEEAQ